MSQIKLPPLSTDQIGRVNAAITQAEQGTRGEIIAVVAGRSSIYWHAPYEAGLWAAGIVVVLATVGSLALGHGWPAWHIGWYCALTVGGFLVGFFAARFPEIERYFADQAIMRAECEERAHRLFTERGVFGTRDRTGVLFYVSVFEHMVVVLGDAAITEKLKPEDYQAVVSGAISGIRDGNLEKGLIDGITLLGQQLGSHFPRDASDVNELPDQLLVIP